MAKNYSGRDYLLYAATSAPANGAYLSLYTKVGLVQSLSISRSRAALDKSNKDDGDESTFVAGRRNVTISASGVLDHQEDAGYTILSNAFEASNGSVWLLVTAANSGDLEWYCAAVITALNVDLPDEGISTFSAEFQVTGALTEASDGGT